MRGEVVADDVRPLVERVDPAQLGEEAEEVGAGAPAPIEAVQEVVLEVVVAERVADPFRAAVGRTQPIGLTRWRPTARLRLYLERPELVDAAAAAAARAALVEAKNSPSYARNSRSFDCFQGLRALEGDAALGQHLPHPFVQDRADDAALGSGGHAASAATSA